MTTLLMPLALEANSRISNFTMLVAGTAASAHLLIHWEMSPLHTLGLLFLVYRALWLASEVKQILAVCFLLCMTAAAGMLIGLLISQISVSSLLAIGTLFLLPEPLVTISAGLKGKEEPSKSSNRHSG